MAQPVFYQTLNMLGIDPTLYYTNLATAGASFTPEYPAPPFIPGTLAFGSDGSQFVFVQASTSISLTDFVVISAGSPGGGTYMANSITTSNATTSTNLNIALGATGIVLKQSVSFIPAGAMFWACTKGQFIPASTSSATGLAVGDNVILYTTTTAGALITTVSTGGSTGALAFAGFTVISSSSLSIATSLVPPVGTLSNGFTVGPVVSLNNPRTFVQISGGAATVASIVSNNSAFW